MGAAEFCTIASGKTVKEAFINAVDDASYEHGHGYTGTIAEKHEYKAATHQTFESFQDAQAFVNQTMDNDSHWCQDKWGPAAYVAFKKGDQIMYLFFGYASS